MLCLVKLIKTSQVKFCVQLQSSDKSRENKKFKFPYLKRDAANEH